MKVIKSFGGLGNQMFQYAFYLYMKKNNDDVLFDISDFTIHKYHQGYELDRIFKIKADEVNRKAVRYLSVNQESKIIRAVHKLFGLKVCRDSEVYEIKGVFEVPFHKIKADVVMRGTWQNSRYIVPIDSEIRKIFCFPELDARNKDILNDFKKYTTVSLHVRRGDYLNTSTYAGICTKDYYEKALAFFKNIRFEKPLKVIVFSDDIPWCRQEYASVNCEFVDWNKGENSYRDMQLMSLCDHNIIANSSFSWWGAYLNNNKEKVVIMPKIWEKGIDGNELVFDNCITM